MGVTPTVLALPHLRLDDEVIGWVVDDRREPWVGLAHAVTVLGNTLTLTVICLVVVAALLIRRKVGMAVLLGAGALLGSAAMVTLKHIFGRTRPPVTDRLLTIESYSFPSGHAMMSMVVYCLLAVVAFGVSGWVRDHRWVLLAAPLLSIAIGLTRIYLAVHWPTDVLAGWAFGAMWVVLCVWIFGLFERWTHRTEVGST